MSNSILVLGGTGKTGRRVAERLEQRNIPVRIGSRSARPSFDWNQPSGWPEVLEGISKVYITYQPDLAVPGSAEAISAFMEAAKKARIQKLVLLSGRGEKEAQSCESIVANSGMDWTIVRANWFMQNFSEGFFVESIIAGELVIPDVNARDPFVHADDIADVVVAALTDDAHSKKTYELTGPSLLSFEKAVDIIASEIGRPVAFRKVSMKEYGNMLREYQVPEDYIWLVQYLFSEVMDGRNESVTGDVKTILGREPVSFEDFVTENTKAGAWNSPAI
jgi:uncharacterized protein YbjT (DUF2867 family)